MCFSRWSVRSTGVFVYKDVCFLNLFRKSLSIRTFKEISYYTKRLLEFCLKLLNKETVIFGEFILDLNKILESVSLFLNKKSFSEKISVNLSKEFKLMEKISGGILDYQEAKELILQANEDEYEDYCYLRDNEPELFKTANWNREFKFFVPEKNGEILGVITNEFCELLLNVKMSKISLVTIYKDIPRYINI